ncbi:MAG: hypothetical protein ACI4WS_07310 [Oscillospiraceae bacterium]
MDYIGIKKKRRVDAGKLDGMRLREKQLRAEISSAAGTSSPEFAGQEKPDPIELLSLNYRNTFDMVGKQHAAELSGRESGEMQRSGAESVYGESFRSERREGDNGLSGLRRRHDFPEYSHSGRQLAEGRFCDRFSDNAFRGGRLAGAVLEGQGRNMFITCVERALTVDKASNEKQRKLLGASAFGRKLDSQPASVMFNRDIKSAVGVAVDAIHGASRVFNVFKGLADGTGALQSNPLEMRGVDTIRSTYPFLSTDSDKALISRYKSRVRALEQENTPEAAREKQSIESALKKAEAVLARKEAEKRKFLSQLTEMQSNAREAEKLFTSEDFARTVLEEIEAKQTDAPPDGSGRRRRSLNEEIPNEQGNASAEQTPADTADAAGPAGAELQRE